MVVIETLHLLQIWSCCPLAFRHCGSCGACAFDARVGRKSLRRSQTQAASSVEEGEATPRPTGLDSIPEAAAEAVEEDAAQPTAKVSSHWGGALASAITTGRVAAGPHSKSSGTAPNVADIAQKAMEAQETADRLAIWLKVSRAGESQHVPTLTTTFALTHVPRAAANPKPPSYAPQYPSRLRSIRRMYGRQSCIGSSTRSRRGWSIRQSSPR